MFAPVELLFSFSVWIAICVGFVFCLQWFDVVVWRQEGHPACKNRVMGCWCGYLSAARCRLAYGSEMTYIVSSGALSSTQTNQPTQLMALQLTVCCFSKIQIGFTFLVPAYPGSPIKWAIKRLYVVFYLVFRPGSRILSRGGANIGTYHSICNRGSYIGKKVIIRGWGGHGPLGPCWIRAWFWWV